MKYLKFTGGVALIALGLLGIYYIYLLLNNPPIDCGFGLVPAGEDPFEYNNCGKNSRNRTIIILSLIDIAIMVSGLFLIMKSKKVQNKQ